MPFEKLVERGCKCDDRPNSDNYGVGTIWVCDTCGKRWEVCKMPGDWGQFWRGLSHARIPISKDLGNELAKPDENVLQNAETAREHMGRLVGWFIVVCIGLVAMAILALPWKPL